MGGQYGDPGVYNKFVILRPCNKTQDDLVLKSQLQAYRARENQFMEDSVKTDAERVVRQLRFIAQVKLDAEIK